ncbi:hypothetical protein H7347_01380 [Corynebacterium sp. zg-331]|uniref:hypothetical protein n=1 Tax=unclassified Corynebacterium TaxID=2624378 RepID=UPI00128DFCEB|nr:MULTISPECIES: hypothetical protein [unclassified Corynebacterium]MBC3185239.1 hypothetical protein [Corynebacterium sp. zg-331]MPV51737.1 hypothetical protein [Corynebacterium sp. zg331]
MPTLTAQGRTGLVKGFKEPSDHGLIAYHGRPLPGSGIGDDHLAGRSSSIVHHQRTPLAVIDHPHSPRICPVPVISSRGLRHGDLPGAHPGHVRAGTAGAEVTVLSPGGWLRGGTPLLVASACIAQAAQAHVSGVFGIMRSESLVVMHPSGWGVSIAPAVSSLMPAGRIIRHRDRS